MKALCWHGHGDVRVDTVPDPKLVAPTDAIIQITSTAICGSDLHLLDGYMPTMESGDILGHEPMGIVVETGSAVKNLKKGDRVVVPFTISCGNCFFCKKDLFAACDVSNPNAEMAKKAMGHSPAGLFGYSHLTGGYAGSTGRMICIFDGDENMPAPTARPRDLPGHRRASCSSCGQLHLGGRGARLRPSRAESVSKNQVRTGSSIPS